MRRELEILIADRAFETRFQPIVDPRSRRPFAHEAFSRAASRFRALEQPTDLFAAARRYDLARPLDQACLELAVRRFQEAELSGRLLLNVFPGTLLLWTGFGPWLEEVLKGWGLEPGRVIVALTGQLALGDVTLLRESTLQLREQGFAIAIDGLGSSSSGMMTWAELRPDYVKIDRYFLTNIEQSPVQAECVRSAVDAARVLGSRVIAEGIESAPQCERVLDLGVDYVQGHFLGLPALEPAMGSAAAAWLEHRGTPKVASLIESVLIEIEPIEPDALVMEAVKRFFADRTLGALPVVSAGKPLGVVWRDDLFTDIVASARESARKPRIVRDVMDDNPPLLDVATRLMLAARFVSEPTGHRQRSEFLVVDPDGYRGIGRTSDLLRRVVEQHQDAASLENPLTLLPGKRRLREQLERLSSTRGSGVLCHLDIDHFKSFNDRYGHARGDQVLVNVSEALSRHADPDVDFIGHAGSDDFVLVMRSRDWRERLTRVLNDFAATVPSFYDAADREAGSIRLAERTGEWRRAPFMSLSVAAIDTVGYEHDLSSPQAAALMRKIEALAKAHPGNAFFLAFGGALFDLSEEFDMREEREERLQAASG
jgi:diguanylate cyclase (GGDEF)-like protein